MYIKQIVYIVPLKCKNHELKIQVEKLEIFVPLKVLKLGTKKSIRKT